MSELFSKIIKAIIPEQTPEQRERIELRKKLVATEVFHDAIVKCFGPKATIQADDERVIQKAQETGETAQEFADRLNLELAQNLAQEWLDNDARKIFPKIDEFEIKNGVVLRHPEQLSEERPQRFTIRQVEAWIDATNHQLDLK
ncbi:MAG: hypothetical protein COV00_01410 [Candidatus Tagabacteria bacterium CG10_big_fil_rev_8_21_14_0_10_40_13]|uniref:Uncharacterized protein n=1 Tax=Candidatus Tagabacteria bacterium CG10_big_fil_rev_8_21_14_0_10_40_13 TaxID=1975022 RepID=A0A2M8L964_9BACT|nr:MAG: hypothetical protein COV00_01410 [Candidatus Tagabacteria bacterium CG10_big_fil_rev_8_21_14_0_10_40_13]